MVHLGVCIYHWGDQEQRRLLVEGVRPWAHEARQRGLAERLWYCSFDARGPHVFAIFTTTPAARPALEAFLHECAGAYLHASPSTVTLEELERRHQECRGKELCSADAQGGLGANNSYVLFEHPDDGYPFQITAGMAAREEFWRRNGELTLWALDQLASGKTQAVALRWLAAVDAALKRQGASTEGYWRFHASTLILTLADRLEEDRDAVVASLPRAVGEKNLAAFARIWDTAAGGVSVDADGLVQLAVAENGRAHHRPFTLLREVNHTVLTQLGHFVRVHIPMVFYAWHRSLAR